jgi:energy-converting hydrogenase B subunit D
VNVLLVVAVLLSGAAALTLVLTRDLVRLAIMSSFYTLTLVVLFLLFQAPDVALSELVVGTIGYPVILLVAILLDRAG